MESDPVFERYRATRARLYARLIEGRVETDAWIDHHATVMPTVMDLARLEALHANRTTLLAELQAAENEFIDHVLRLKEAPKQ